jgi:hypothetical protein
MGSDLLQESEGEPCKDTYANIETDTRALGG